jgi:hypothetical protein
MSNQDFEDKMYKKAATGVQLLMGILSCLGVVIAVYISMLLKDANHDKDIEFLRSSVITLEKKEGDDFKALNNGYKEIQDGISEIKLLLKDKQDRK